MSESESRANCWVNMRYRLVERLWSDFDNLRAITTLTSQFLAALLDATADILSGKEMPQSDVKPLRIAPEPAPLPAHPTSSLEIRRRKRKPAA